MPEYANRFISHRETTDKSLPHGQSSLASGDAQASVKKYGFLTAVRPERRIVWVCWHAVEVKDLVRLLRRIAVTVAGTVILVVGVVLLVAPGPGLVVIALALAVFAIEYGWARRHLAAVQARARSAALKAAASRVATACTVLFGVGALGLGAVLALTDLLPLSSIATGASVAIAGLTVLATLAYSIRELRRTEKTEEDEDAQ
jgi:uncharacterized protein (TIGR02611 family)